MTILESGPDQKAVTKEQQPIVAPTTWRDRVKTWWLVVAILVGWVIVWSFTEGKNTLIIGEQETTKVQRWLIDTFNKFVDSNNFIVTGLHKFGDFLGWLVTQLQLLLSQPDVPRPYPQIGWLGVLAIAVWIALAIAGWRISILVGLSFLAFGYLGYWADSIDTLIITGIAVVIAVIIGIPLSIWMGRSKVASAVITPILDILQTFPGFTYLLPLALFFGIGSASAVVATLLFAFPAMVRIAAHGIRTVSKTSLEATRSLGQTRMQEIRKVQLPMAKRTIIVGINQTTMAALSMVIIAAFVSAPGLGGPVLQGLTAQQVGQAFVPGLAIVIMAIMLDRTTTAASERAEKLQRAGGGNKKLRYGVLGVTGIIMLVCVYLSHYYVWAAGFPTSSLGTTMATKVQSFADWVSTTFSSQAQWLSNFVSDKFLNPLQNLIADSPWYVTATAILLLAAVLAGRWAVLTTVICLGGLLLMGLWYNSMVTLSMTLVATVFVMILALIFGVWMGRSLMADRVIRPWLDAAQTLPPFVYLIPVLALFQPTRFTSIVAAVAFAAPASIKIVADAIRSVSVTTVEAATAMGSNRWQIISKVQVPMARGGIVLAANQGLLYVLSMAVIGGLVGAGALGFDVVQGFSQADYAGKGLAASISIVLIGIMLDRITRRAALRSGGGGGHH